jgi:citrate lyase subunit beta/citryl-CoA lyase
MSIGNARIISGNVRQTEGLRWLRRSDCAAARCSCPAPIRAPWKKPELPVDGLIFDLEDAVAPDGKDDARARVVAALRAGGYGPRERILRVNSLDTPWGQADLVAAATMPLDAVLLPKVESAEQVRIALGLLEERGAPPGLQVWCMIETPLGVLAAAEIAVSSPRLGALVVGTTDLTADLHAREVPDRWPLLTALGIVVLAGRAHGRAILDGVHLRLDDAGGFAAVCRQGRELGFDGKTLIHPSQIEPANAAFSPSAEEIAWARRILAAYTEAAGAGKGAVRIDGRLVEALHLEAARRTLVLSNAIAARASG